MKKMGIFIFLLSICMIFGCAAGGPYAPGIVVSNYDRPACFPSDASGLQIGEKVGLSKMVNYLGCVSIGDASVSAAAKSAGISKVQTIDVHYDSVLGIINSTTTKVTGN